uniref:Carboxypeptidase n=1 Tax=Brassica campestris TaxID=3711 RepID=M4E1R5_BRACM
MASYGALAVTMVVVVVTVHWFGCNFAEGYPEEDLVARLPGQPKVLFRQYAGYVDGDFETGRSLFYYFVEADTHPETKPLTLWLNGVLWFSKFPELKARHFFLTGESYAGHYIPQLADAIHSYNRQSSGFKINVKGIAIGNPLLKLDTDTSAAYEFLWSHGLISDEHKHAIIRQCDFTSLPNISKACIEALTEVSFVTKYVNVYDVLLDLCFPSIIEQELRLKKMATQISMGVDVCMMHERQFYFNLPEVQHALHANRTHLPYQWSMCSTLVNYSGIDGNINMLPILKRIIQNKTSVWIFSGDQDSVVPLLGSRTLVRELAHDLNFSTTLPYGPWFHKDQVGGWVTEYGKLLTFATVRGAAHMVPYAQPSRALHLFSSFVRGRRLPNNTHERGEISLLDIFS